MPAAHGTGFDIDGKSTWMLNSNLNWQELHRTFSSDGRILIPDILDPERADGLHQCLASQVEWDLSYKGKDGPTILKHGDLMTLTPAERKSLNQSLHASATEDFSFYFQLHNLKARKHPPLTRFLDFICDQAFQGFVQYVTGEDRVSQATAMATCYSPTCFLRQHNDFEQTYSGDQGLIRKIAFVFGLTRNWQPDWGGSLTFLNQDNEILDTIVPRFNTLTMFSVPAEHYISQVASYATEKRYAITGWLLEPVVAPDQR